MSLNSIFKKISKKLYLIAILSLMVSNASAIEYLDTKGKDFWLTFLPNSHKTSFVTTTDSLFIFVSSEVPTKGVIEYYDRQGKFYSKNFVIPKSNDLFKFALQYFNYELWGYKSESSINTRFQSEMISNLAFHIKSDDEVTVYAHSQARQTSDAFLVMPTDVIDKNYVLATFNSDGNNGASSSGSGPMPSEFAIIASEDNTNVTIKPKAQTQYNGLNTQKILLNKGEVYLVQAKIDASNLQLDLTGTMIDADKPVAVFGGHQKCLIPAASGVSSGSRDHLVEQIPPIKVFGQSAFITPFKQPTGVSSFYNDLYRIIAPYNNTKIYINNTLVTTLNAGEFYQNYITGAAVVTGSSSFLLVQYKKTSDFSGGTNYGDPFMLVVPPQEQYMKSYTTINVQAYETLAPVYKEQFLTIVIPTNAINSFRLDGAAVNSGQFATIPNSTYSYGNIAVSDGVHHTTADSAFGIYVYGYGVANSFGYTGGMSFAPIDFSPPQITALEDCYKIHGLIYDSTFSDSGIMTYQSPDASKINCTVNFGNTSAKARTVSFVAQLSDIRFDGKFIIEATDSNKLHNSQTFDIKGFTVGINGSETSTNPQSYTELIPPDSTKCYKILLHNYGKFPQNIKKYILNNNTNFIVTTAFPLTINPGDVVPVEICFNSKDENIYRDSLILVSDCNDLKNLVEFKISTKLDKYPQITSNEECYKTSGVIYDSTKSDTGLALYISPDSSKINCNVNFLNIAGDRKKVDFVSQLNDKRFDGKFSIIAIDSSNLTSVKDFEIKGFTIGINGDEYSNNLIKFDDSLRTGKSKCYIIPIHNYGKFIQTLNSYSIKNSADFTVNTTFPLQINPGEIENIEICFNTDSDSLFLDSFAIINDCGDLKNFADFKITTGQDKYPPRITKSSDSCTKEFTIFVSDSANWDSGISEILVEDSINCKIQIASRTQNSAKIYIKVIEFNKDMYFSISISDSNGHKILISDTLISSEIRIFGIDSVDSKTKHFGNIVINSVSKDSITIYNSGILSLTFNNIIIKNNINFSIPPSQFPVTINPKDSTKLYICFSPTNYTTEKYIDTLLIDSYCINQEIILTGYGKSIDDTTNTKCQIKLVLNSVIPPTNFKIENIYPNPVSESATIIFENNIQSVVQIDLYGSTGEFVGNYLNNELMGGKYDTTLTFKNLSSGLYFIRISNAYQSLIKPIMINK